MSGLAADSATVAAVTTRAAPAGSTAREGQAGLGRRLLALMVDWLLAVAISAGFFAYDPTATLVIFFVMTTVLVGTAGFTIGHRALGLAIRDLAGGAPGPLRAAVRTLGLCLLIPAVVWGPDGRGLHDRWAGTQIVRTR
jgi:uncharacterized RDD family membrane protein YckC